MIVANRGGGGGGGGGGGWGYKDSYVIVMFNLLISRVATWPKTCGNFLMIKLFFYKYSMGYYYS